MFRMWRGGAKDEEYHTYDDMIKEQFDIFGACIFVHKFLGPQANLGSEEATLPENNNINENNIQDLLFLENRDRTYSEQVYELRAIMTHSEHNFDLRQFGIFDPDMQEIRIHYNDMVERIGRKLMAGDVIEFPHLREYDALDESKAFNKYYVVSDASKAADGYDMSWNSHVYRLMLKSMTNSQEFSGILEKDDLINDSPLDELLTSFNRDIAISAAIEAEFTANVPKRNFDATHLYIIPGTEDGIHYPWIFTGDGEPPNGAELLGSGDSFPVDAEIGEWFLRVDYEPSVLYQKTETCWKRKEVDYAKTYTTAHRILASFLNNNETTEYGGSAFTAGEIIPQKQALSKAFKPKPD